MADELKQLAAKAAGANAALARLFGVPVFLVDLLLMDMNKTARARFEAVKRNIVQTSPEYSREYLDDALEFVPATKDKPDIKIFVHESKLEDRQRQQQVDKSARQERVNLKGGRLFKHGPYQQTIADHTQQTERVHLSNKTIQGNRLAGGRLRPLKPIPLHYQQRRMQKQYVQVTVEARGSATFGGGSKVAALQERVEKELAAG